MGGGSFSGWRWEAADELTLVSSVEGPGLGVARPVGVMRWRLSSACVPCHCAGLGAGPQGLRPGAGPPVPGGEKQVSGIRLRAAGSLPHSVFLISAVSGFPGWVFVVAEANFPS